MVVDGARSRLERLLRELGKRGRMAVAFSACVDSTLLLEMAHRVLGEGVLAVTAASAFVPDEDVDEARAFCEARGIEHVVLAFDPFSVEGLSENPKDRCYWCKRAIMGGLVEEARARGCVVFADGTNADDVSGNAYRPGIRALEELGFVSPLADAGLSKADVRALARELGIEAWDKPAAACLATRFPYGASLTPEGLQRVGEAERILRDLGFTQVRVRVEGELARIELLPEEFALLLEGDRAAEVDRRLRALGFSRVTLDLAGFASGSWDAPLGDNPSQGA